MIWDAEANRAEMVKIRVVEVGIFTHDEGDFSWHVLTNETLGGFVDEGVFCDGAFRLWNEGEDFARADIAFFEINELF